MRAFCSRYTFHFNALRNYLRKLERRPKWQHIRFTYDILSFLWSVQPLKVTPAYTGGKHCACFRRTHSRGSPPRMRGKGIHTGQQGRWHRITPAHAGKSPRPARSRPRGWDHPRACGEKLNKNIGGAVELGSPSRMRGKGAAHLPRQLEPGITPRMRGKDGLGVANV